jgi:hypothetical protein
MGFDLMIFDDLIKTRFQSETQNNTFFHTLPSLKFKNASDVLTKKTLDLLTNVFIIKKMTFKFENKNIHTNRFKIGISATSDREVTYSVITIIV